MAPRPHTVSSPPDRPRAAAAQLAERFERERRSVLAGVARRNGVSGDAVDDVVQDALLSFIQAFKGDPEDERGAWAYLCRAVQTRAWRVHRTAARRPVHRHLEEEVSEGGRPLTVTEVTADIGSPDPVERAIEMAAAEERRELLAQLPAEWRAVLALGAAGYTATEIARLTGMSERQVRKRVQKAHARLAGLLAERDAGGDAA